MTDRSGHLAAAALLAFAACGQAAELRPAVGLPQINESVRLESCYNGVGFFRVGLEELQGRLPAPFSPRDGSILGAAHAGYGLVALIYYSCLRPGGAEQFALIATPVDDPPWSSDLRSVRWNWYELARLVDTEIQLQRAHTAGLAAQRASLSHEPFEEGHTTSSFKVETNDGVVASVTAALADSMNFQPQSHRFWHLGPEGQLVSTRLDFEYHHSWIGDFGECLLDAALLTAVDLSGLECSGIGVTEAIESLTFTRETVLWR